MTRPAPTRRDFCAALSVSALGSLAGCSAVFGDGATPTQTPLDLRALDGRKVYVDPLLSLSVPTEVEAVDSPGLADVMVVPGDTDRSRSAIVHWLARDAAVAFLGDGAQATWQDVKASGAYAAMLGEPQAGATGCAGSGGAGGGSGSGGSGGGSGGGGSGGAGGAGSRGSATPADCEPPDLVVARYLREREVGATYRKTWGATDDPDAREVFEAIDEALAGW